MKPNTLTPNAAKHTPGPWTVIGGGLRKIEGWGRCACVEIEAITSTGFNPVAIVTDRQSRAELPDSKEFAESEANARLIAAAPDLLEALRPLLFEVEQVLISTQHFPECAVKQSRRCAVELARAAIAKAEGRA